MPRIRKPSKSAPGYNEAKGLYFRSLGRKVTQDDEWVQHKFYVGGNEREAILRIARLESLWELVKQNHDADLGDFCADQEQPAWHEDTTLAIAKAIAKGEESVKLEFPLGEPMDAAQQAQWLTRLSQRYPSRITGVEIKPADEWGHVIGVGQTLVAAKRLRLQADGLASSVMTHNAGSSLHTALDAYAAFVLATKLTAPDEQGNKRPTEHAQKERERVLRIKAHVQDMSLTAFNSEAIERLTHYWASRPKGQRGKAMRIATCKAHNRTFFAFVRWLKRSSFDWRMPYGLELSDIKPKYQETLDELDDDLNGLFDAEQVPTYTIPELVTIYQYAAPLERAMLLLALNCGLIASELCSLSLQQISLRKIHPLAEKLRIVSTAEDSWIARKRTKTKKAAQWKLWPETVQAIEWAKQRRERITHNLPTPAPKLLFITETGAKFNQPTKSNNTTQRIPNKWRELIESIQVDKPDFRYLSFKFLRKTSGNFIKLLSDGETMGAFHARHKIVGDDHADIYANRLWCKVFEAIQGFHQQLVPMFVAVVDPFPAEHKKGGANISLGTILKIEELAAKNVKPAEIAKMLGLHVATVYRRMPRKPR